MVHIAPPSPSRRRFELAVGLGLALLGVLIAAVAIVALNHPKGRQAPTANAAAAPSTSAHPSSTANSTSAAHTTAPTKTAAKSPPTKTQSNRLAVVVLNNTSTSGLAETAAARFRQGGWTATTGGNFEGSILSTAAYYDPSVPGAQAAATALQSQFPAIKRVKPRFTGLPEGPIIVIVTTDYS
jgi:hypothetical protein